MALLPDGTGGYVLDGFGRLHPFGIGGNAAPPAATGARYSAASDWARGVALMPDGTSGYVIDGSGRFFGFSIGNNRRPPKPNNTPNLAGDLARGITITASGAGGYLVEASGRIHRFGIGGAALPMVASGGPSWPGRNLARGIALSRADGGGFVLDRTGALHPFATRGHTPARPLSRSAVGGPGPGARRRSLMSTGPHLVRVGNNVSAMQVESRDSISLKPAELDELGQLLASVGLSGMDHELEAHVEHFPLVVMAMEDEGNHGFLFGSLERVGGTPCILWGLGAVRRGRQAGAAVKGLVGELYRRAAISFPDEDVLVAGRIAHPAAYSLLGSLADVVPRLELLADRRGAGLGSPAGSALRLRGSLRRPGVPGRRDGEPRGGARREHGQGRRQGGDRGGRHRRRDPR